MNTKQQPAFKESQLFDRHTAPKEERGSRSFLESTFEEERSKQPSPAETRSSNTLLVPIVVIGAFGVAGMLGLARVLHG